MPLLDVVIGKALATSDERAEQIGTSAGIPIFGLDALSSAAYDRSGAHAPDSTRRGGNRLHRSYKRQHYRAAQAIVYFSYRQTIAAYPGGGGSYTVASENLGTYPGLLAASRPDD